MQDDPFVVRDKAHAERLLAGIRDGRLDYSRLAAEIDVRAHRAALQAAGAELYEHSQSGVNAGTDGAGDGDE